MKAPEDSIKWEKLISSRCSIGNPFSVAPCVLGKIARGAEFFPGCRVLARREVDGFYYLGTIVHQLQVKQKF